MGSVIAAALVMMATVANPPVAGATVDGVKMTFAAKDVATGAAAILAMAGSCTTDREFNAVWLKKAQDGNHVRVAFPKPVSLRVMNEKLQVAEVYISLPIGSAVVWVRDGDTFREYSKFQFKPSLAVGAWLRAGKPAD